jgi:choline-sulfatase
MVDQLTAFALKAYGGTVCKTPNLDALTARGVVFENAYTPYPLCAPARFSMMSGQLPSRIGAFDNGAEFTAATPTFAHYLRLLGYYTSISGKMHFVGPDQYHGYEERLTTEIYPADFSWTPVAGYQDPLLDQERSYTVGVSTMETVLDAGPLARSMQIDYDEEVTHCAVRELFTRARSSDKRPFMLTVSLTHPHDPYVTRQEYWDRYSDDEIDMPKTGFVPLDERDPHSRSLYYHYGQDKTEITAEACRNARHGYYGMISYIDDLFGEVMTALDETGFADNTAVVFTSDHGDMMGERGMWFKKTLFEPAIRTPLIIARPGQVGSRSTAPASLVDIFPTILDLAQAPDGTIQTPVDGRSLLPELEGKAVSTPVYSEHIDGGTLAPRVMVREGDMKLVYSLAYPNQLYDLAADPAEMDDLSGKDEYRAFEDQLVERVKANWDLEALSREVYANQTARKLIDSALSKGRREIWDFTTGATAQSGQFVRHGDFFPDAERRGYFPYPQKS